MKYRIRSWESMAAEFRLSREGSIVGPCGCHFNTLMKHLCGRVVTVVGTDFSCYSDGRKINLEFDDSSGDTGFSFRKWMLEEIPLYSFKLHVNNPCCEAFFLSGTRTSANIKLQDIREREQKKMRKEIKVENLRKLADPAFAKELVQYGVAGVPANIKQALEKRIEKDREEAAEQAAEEIFFMIKGHDEAIALKVQQLRNIRRQEENIKKDIERLNNALAYGHETSNYLPLADALDDHHPEICASIREEERSIPKDWKPAAKAE